MSDPKPTMGDALRTLQREGTAGGLAIDELRRRWRNGEGSLSPDKLADDPALQKDPSRSVIPSSGNLQGALQQFNRVRNRMTTVTEGRIRREPNR